MFSIFTFHKVLYSLRLNYVFVADMDNDAYKWVYHSGIFDMLKKIAEKHGVPVSVLIKFIVTEALSNEDFVRKFEEKYGKIPESLKMWCINQKCRWIKKIRFVAHSMHDAEFWIKRIDQALNGRISDDAEKKVYFLKFLDKDTLLFLRKEHLELKRMCKEWLGELKGGRTVSSE